MKGFFSLKVWAKNVGVYYTWENSVINTVNNSTSKMYPNLTFLFHLPFYLLNLYLIIIFNLVCHYHSPLAGLPAPGKAEAPLPASWSNKMVIYPVKGWQVIPIEDQVQTSS